jgi:hypothetical protein
MALFVEQTLPVEIRCQLCNYSYCLLYFWEDVLNTSGLCAWRPGKLERLKGREDNLVIEIGFDKKPPFWVRCVTQFLNTQQFSFGHRAYVITVISLIMLWYSGHLEDNFWKWRFSNVRRRRFIKCCRDSSEQDRFYRHTLQTTFLFFFCLKRTGLQASSGLSPKTLPTIIYHISTTVSKMLQ